MRSSLLTPPGQGPRWFRPGHLQPGSRGVCIPYRRTERRFRQSGPPSPESARRRQAGSPAVCRSASLACRWISTHRGVTPRIGSSIDCSTHPSPCCATRTYFDGQRCRRYRIECAHGMDSARLNPPARSVGADDFVCRKICLPPTAWSTWTRSSYRSDATTASRHWRTEFNRAIPSRRSRSLNRIVRSMRSPRSSSTCR